MNFAKYSAFLMLTLATLNLFGQITITNSDMPVSGDTIRYSSASALNLGSLWMKKGGSQSWDFSKLTPTASGLYEYQSALKTKYAFYFFGQTGLLTADTLGGGPLTFTNVYTFYSNSKSVYKAEGIGYTTSGIPLAANYKDEDEIYQFPLEYNDSDVTAFDFQFSIPGQNAFSFKQSGKRTNVVDAWGSITTPFGIYKDVIRVRTFVDEVDTIISIFGKTPIARKQLSFKWLSNEEHIPVLEIQGQLDNQGRFTPVTILYRDSFRGLNTGGSGGNQPNFVADFKVNKVKGEVGKDTFKFTNLTKPFAATAQWQFNPVNGAQFVNGTSQTSINPEVIFTQAGTYTVKLTSGGGPNSDDTTYNDLIFVGWGVGTEKIQNNQIGVNPNPVKNELTITSLQANISINNIRCYSFSGQEIKIQTMAVKEGFLVNTSDWAQGIYFLKIGNQINRIIKE